MGMIYMIKANIEIIFEIFESVDGGYEAKAIGHSIFTQFDNHDELENVLREAVECHFDNDNMPQIIRAHFVKDILFAI